MIDDGKDGNKLQYNKNEPNTILNMSDSDLKKTLNNYTTTLCFNVFSGQSPTRSRLYYVHS